MNKGRYVFTHLFWLCLSALLLGIGCACFVRADIGGDAMTTLMMGLFESFAIPLSYGNLILNITMFILAFLIERKQIGIGSILYPFFSSLGMSIGEIILPSVDSPFHMIMFVSGMLLLCFAIALGSKTSCGKNPYDALCFAIMEKCHVKYNAIRSLIDALMLVSGMLLGGSFAVGTIISVLCIGTIAMLMMDLLEQCHWLMLCLNKGGDS